MRSWSMPLSMAKRPKPTAIGDLQTLENRGAIVHVGDGIRLECRLADFTVEPINEPLNDGLDERLLKFAGRKGKELRSVTFMKGQASKEQMTWEVLRVIHHLCQIEKTLCK